MLSGLRKASEGHRNELAPGAIATHRLRRTILRQPTSGLYGIMWRSLLMEHSIFFGRSIRRQSGSPILSWDGLDWLQAGFGCTIFRAITFQSWPNLMSVYSLKAF